MKRPLLLILSLILVFFIFTNFSFTSAAEAPEPVLDVAGKKLRTDIYYYILPANFGAKFRFGGVTLSSIGNETCPLGVFQEMSEHKKGIPVKFFPVNPKKGVVRVSTGLNIQFAYPEACGQSPVWRVDNYNDPEAENFVSIGGLIGRALPDWFEIEKFGYDSYKIMYCPTVCSYCDVLCKDVGILYQNGKRCLFLSDHPIKVVFKKA